MTTQMPQTTVALVWKTKLQFLYKKNGRLLSPTLIEFFSKEMGLGPHVAEKWSIPRMLRELDRMKIDHSFFEHTEMNDMVDLLDIASNPQGEENESVS